VSRIDLDAAGTGELAGSVPLIHADLRHALGNTGTGVVVAVLDSGIASSHTNLRDALIAEACFGDRNGRIDGVGFCNRSTGNAFRLLMNRGIGDIRFTDMLNRSTTISIKEEQ
jgi:subtilisin family serine protease